MILAIALFGVLVISAVAITPKAYASGGLMSLVAHAAQDVYQVQSNTTKLKYDVNKFWTKLQSEEHTIFKELLLMIYIGSSIRLVYPITEAGVEMMEDIRRSSRNPLLSLWTGLPKRYMSGIKT